ncbi:unnamed protein product [Cuscuta epithymum]|uniref:phosphoribosylaminoimidazolesuccinocarboxamide synthase n=1 Tax=Cuscuta epithymum TaxID=186058 RepID=A0AAV0DSL9_9ASTE|nr:unnamed protein product [Cuscuta epithymum]CAH9128723.1 unnamed protein product [Cuscuta epithymum]
MAQSLLNPTNTHHKNLTLAKNHPRIPFFSSPSSSCKVFPTMKNKYPLIRAASVVPPSNHQEKQNIPTLDALINGKSKEEIMLSISNSLSNCLSETHLDLTVPGLKSKTRGKVRDIYDGGDYLVLVTTDRQSAFDRILASIPFKGAE